MDREELLRRKRAIIGQHGPWTAHTIRLADGVYTSDEAPDFQSRLSAQGSHLRRILQIAADLAGKPLGECRVLDLACLEGMYGVEFALHRAEVVGIEGRETNAVKARFAGEALGLERYSIEVDDVRNLSAARYGRFDVVLCLGILYHLDAPDVFRLIEQIGEVCTRLAIIDTHVVRSPRRTFTHSGKEFAGQSVIEHLPWTPDSVRKKKLWASLDNTKALWLTRSSLHNLLAHAGFTSTYTCEIPSRGGWMIGRDTVAAVRATPATLQSTPAINAVATPPIVEKTVTRYLSQVVARRRSQAAFLFRLWRSWFGKK